MPVERILARDTLVIVSATLAFFLAAHGYGFQALVYMLAAPVVSSWESWLFITLVNLASVLYGGWRKGH